VCTHALPHALQLQTQPPSRDRLWHCLMPYSSRPCLAAEVGSDATTCPEAPDLASQLRWALVLPCVLRL
jgi:hypothetical protein